MSIENSLSNTTSNTTEMAATHDIEFNPDSNLVNSEQESVYQGRCFKCKNSISSDYCIIGYSTTVITLGIIGLSVLTKQYVGMNEIDDSQRKIFYVGFVSCSIAIFSGIGLLACLVRERLGGGSVPNSASVRPESRDYEIVET